MKKSTKKKILILVMSVALVAANFAVFSMVDSRHVGEAGKATSALADSSDDTEQKGSSQTATEKKEERKALEAVLGTEKNLEAVNDKLQIVDGTGEELELADLGKDEYDGFIYKLAEPTETELAVMTEAADELPKDAEVDTVVEGSTYVADSLETISKVAAAGKLEYVEPNYKASLLEGEELMAVADDESEQTDVSEAKLNYTPSDTYYNDNFKWVQEYVNIPQVWDKGMFGENNVTVAIIDSGVDYDHSDLNGENILPGKYYVDGESGDGAKDNYWHGTFVAGVIAAQHNAIGVAGAMPNVKILPLKVFESDDGEETYGGDLSDIAKAINYAADYKYENGGVEYGVDVINMSLGVSYETKSIYNACQYAVNKGIIIVAAAGNDHSSARTYPASSENVISVGSINKKKTKSDFSNYNSAVDVVGVGSGVAGLGCNNEYKSSNGTSFSTPQIAAMAAMAKSMNGRIDAWTFDTLIEKTAVDLGSAGRDNYYGYGLADFEAAYTEVKDNNPAHYGAHSWDEGTIIRQAGCENTGLIEYHCTIDGCRKTKRESLSSLGHVYCHIDAGNGCYYYQCTRCGAQKNFTSPSYVKSFKLSKGKKSFTAKWKKQSKKNQKKFSGYQVRYSTDPSMYNATYRNVSKKKASVKIKGSKKTRYYVQVRTYIGEYYSSWSSVKSVVTK